MKHEKGVKMIRHFGKRSLRKIIIGILLCTSLVSFGSFVFIITKYDYTRPRSPQPRLGRIYPVTTTHGTDVYVTREEAVLFNWLEFISFISIALTIGYNFSFDPLDYRNKEKFKQL